MTLRIRTLVMASIVLRSLLLAACATTSSRSSHGGDGSFSVVTLNLYHDRDGWPQRRALVIEGLGALKPDVIGLQEVLQHETLRNQAEDIAGALGYECYFVSADPPGATRRFGNAILTRHPVLERSERRLRPRDDWRTLAHLRLAIRGSIVDVYNTHLHHTAEGDVLRARQLRDVLSHIAARDDGTPSLLLGDFNAEVTNPELRPLAASYVDVFGGVHDDADSITTLNPHYFGNTVRRIDHVFAQRDRFEMLDARRVLDRPGVAGAWPSDHFGLHARLRLRHAR
ncbi:MAG: endonuclease/exonuclease/phosphatase family protein [Woeseia sp.]